jgi:hypothetical protein
MRVPLIASAGARPFGHVGDAGVLEFVHREVFRPTLDGEITAGAAWDGEIAGDAGGVVPVVESLR